MVTIEQPIIVSSLPTPAPTSTKTVSPLYPVPLAKAAIQDESQKQTGNVGVLDSNPTEYPQMGELIFACINEVVRCLTALCI